MPQTIKRLKGAGDLYKTFSGKDQLSATEFRLILKYFHKLLRHSLIYDGKTYLLPKHLGWLGVRSRIPTKYGIMNFQIYKETGLKLPRTNNHADGRIARLVREVLSFNPVKGLNPHVLRAFKFEACRGLNRELAQAIMNENTISLYKEHELRKH